MSQVLFWEWLKLPEGGCVGRVRKSEWDSCVDEQVKFLGVCVCVCLSNP